MHIVRVQVYPMAYVKSQFSLSLPVIRARLNDGSTAFATLLVHGLALDTLSRQCSNGFQLRFEGIALVDEATPSSEASLTAPVLLGKPVDGSPCLYLSIDDLPSDCADSDAPAHNVVGSAPNAFVVIVQPLWIRYSPRVVDALARFACLPAVKDTVLLSSLPPTRLPPPYHYRIDIQSVHIVLYHDTDPRMTPSHSTGGLTLPAMATPRTPTRYNHHQEVSEDPSAGEPFCCTVVVIGRLGVCPCLYHV